MTRRLENGADLRGPLQVSGAAGTSGQVLTSAGTGAVPTWTTPSGGGGASAITISAKTGAYTVVAGDLGTIINCTSGTFTVSLTAAATLGSGFYCWIWNTGDGTVTIDPAGSETIDGTGTTYILRPRAGVQIVCNGTSWITGDVKAYRLYQESNPDDANFTRPIASGSRSFAIGSSASATGTSSLAIGLTSTASATSAVAIGGGGVTASSTSSTAIGNNSGGGGSQTVTGSGAMALGGSYASGTDSFAAGIATNSSSYGATGNNSVAIGYQARASGLNSLSIGYLGIASATGAISLGYLSTASGAVSTAMGYQSNSSISGKFSYASGQFTAGGSSLGEAQAGIFVLRQQTSDATPAALSTNTSAAAATNQIVLPNNSAYAFHGTIVARQQASTGTASAAWKIEGLIRREGTAASTTLVASTVTAISNVPGWTLALSADTTNGGLKIEATGAAATNIRWVATINTSEVTY